MKSKHCSTLIQQHWTTQSCQLKQSSVRFLDLRFILLPVSSSVSLLTSSAHHSTNLYLLIVQFAQQTRQMSPYCVVLIRGDNFLLLPSPSSNRTFIWGLLAKHDQVCCFHHKVLLGAEWIPTSRAQCSLLCRCLQEDEPAAAIRVQLGDCGTFCIWCPRGRLQMPDCQTPPTDSPGARSHVLGHVGHIH